jgi:hypothetical protein
MDFKETLYLAIASSIGGILGLLKSDDKINAKKALIKLLSALMIGVFIIPGLMDYFDFSLRAWLGFAAVSSVMAEPVIDLLLEKLKTKIDEKL